LNQPLFVDIWLFLVQIEIKKEALEKTQQIFSNGVWKLSLETSIRNGGQHGDN
jgi:hypothetical protein